jgi:glucose-1-phosphate thymidylyltransferase
MMKVIIPAAGVGNRLRPLTITKPKPLLPVADKPIIGHILDRVFRLEVDEITIIIGHRGEQLENYIVDNYPAIFKFVEQEEPKGLGHAIELGLEERDKPVLIILGDTILDLDFARFINHRENVIGVMEVENPRLYGIVETEGDKVKQVVEKPEHSQSNLGIAGIYLIQHEFLLKQAIRQLFEKEIMTKDEYQLTDALQVLLEWDEPIVVEKIQTCYDCGTRETLLDTNRHLLEKLPAPGVKYPKSVIIPPVFIHPGAVIIRSIIGPYVSIGQGVTVEESLLKDMIIDENSTVRRTNLSKSIIGENTELTGIG